MSTSLAPAASALLERIRGGLIGDDDVLDGPRPEADRPRRLHTATVRASVIYCGARSARTHRPSSRLRKLPELMEEMTEPV
ncbi:hypothetical protein [Streptomyces sp. R35]|uniref:Uncharacterized protein n=1 Tax=Streptomyces sp. R35 TaxID=3238630 RepID=A0AB39SJU8_9ACTN